MGSNALRTNDNKKLDVVELLDLEAQDSFEPVT